MRSSGALILLILSVVLLPAIASPARGTGTTIYITIYDYGFTPKNENVTTGTTIVWNNTGTQPHTVYSSGTPSFQSSPYNLERYGQTGQHTYSVFFGQPGVYNYYCNIHVIMQGTLNVTGSPVSPPSGGASSLGDYLIPIAVLAAVIVIGALLFLVRRNRSRKIPMPRTKVSPK